MTPPRLILGLRDLIEYVCEHITNLMTNTDDIRAQLTRMEKQQMATKAEVLAALDALKTAWTAKVQAVSDQLAALTTSFEQFRTEDTTEDAAFQATIADLQRQLAEASSLNDEVLVAIQSTTAAVEG